MDSVRLSSLNNRFHSPANLEQVSTRVVSGEWWVVGGCVAYQLKHCVLSWRARTCSYALASWWLRRLRHGQYSQSRGLALAMRPRWSESNVVLLPYLIGSSLTLTCAAPSRPPPVGRPAPQGPRGHSEQPPERPLSRGTPTVRHTSSIRRTHPPTHNTACRHLADHIERSRVQQRRHVHGHSASSLRAHGRGQ